MAEAIISSIAGEIAAKLDHQSLEKVGNLWGVKHELEVLRDVVFTLRPVLDHAEEKYYQSHEIQVWLNKLKDAFYDAQDVLEEINIEATRQELSSKNEMFKEVRTFFSSSNQLAFKLKMSCKVRAVRERIEVIANNKNFHLGERPMHSREFREWGKREETYSFICKGDIVGRDDDKKKVMKFLLDSDMQENVSILPIVGIGGLGKTSLARWVYNDEMVRLYFDLKMWVHVSADFGVKQIVKTMVCAMTKEQTTFSMERLQRTLRELIDGKRYFLVLDDWCGERESWFSLKSLLMGGARGSKILITTRLPSITEIACNVPPHFLYGLSESASLNLLMRMSGLEQEEIQDPDRLAISTEIVRKCSGVPLVVQTVGNLLYYKRTKFEWLHFKDDELPEVSQSEDNVKKVLRLSYDHLPSHLKQCFALCSLFPKNYEINKHTLINLWVAEGFVQPSNTSQHLEDIAHGYFIDLLMSNFFQDYEKDTETCKMHDLMHDLACLVTGTECCVAWDDKNPVHERTRHISHGLTSNFMREHLILCWRARSLKTYFFALTYHEMEERKPTSESDLCHLIRIFKRLRILDLHAAIVKKVPMSICKLKHLTYLDLSHNYELKRLPNSITRLQNLQTLNLRGCFALEELPRDIWKLISLQNLDIDYCYSLNYVPRGLGQLTCLQRLTRFILPEGKYLAKNYCGLEGLNRLNNIRGSLSIENLGHSRNTVEESRAANLTGKHYLESLILKWSYIDNDAAVIGNIDEALLDELRPHSNLQKLVIHGYKSESFPRWIMDSLVSFLPHLVEVRLLRCRRCKHLPQLGELPLLKSLEIWRLTKLECIESNHSSTSIASFPNLLRLKIQYCENLEGMPLAPRVEDLILRKVNRKLINHIYGLTKLKSLDISRIKFLKCLPSECLRSLTSLERLGISECPHLTSLSLGMRHLSNLMHLSLSNCEELNLSIDESNNILDLQGLNKLRSVDILGVPKLAHLPRWLLQVSNLKHLSIKNCLKLKDLPKEIEALRSLQQLEIILCPLLTSLPEAMRRLKSLAHLKITDCPNLEELCDVDGEDWDKIAHIPNITLRRSNTMNATYD